MSQRATSSWRNLLVAMPALALLISCAGSGGLPLPNSDAPLFVDKTLSVVQAQRNFVPGQSTQADVLSALGPATVLKFDSGYEVWVYRSRPGRMRDEKRDTHTELVMLFSPAGVLEKSRIRPATPKPVQQPVQ